MSQIVRVARAVAVVVVIALCTTSAAVAMAPESKRLIRARDYIADEQWTLAIEQLRAAVADPKETRRDEALYWLAHSQHHSGDPGAAVQTIARLERDFPSSMWVKPAQSLRIAIAVRLQRSDVLWWAAMPPPAAPTAVVAPRPPKGRTGPPVPPREPTAPPAAAPKPVAAPKIAAPPVPPPPAIWQVISPDDDLRIQALGGLMQLDDAEKAVPILGKIAFESEHPAAAKRAVFMLAQSPLPKARETVVQVAKTAPEPLRVAAVTYLGRFGGPDVSEQLLSVYVTADEPVRWQIVKSLGERLEKSALLTIVSREKDGKVRSGALVSLARAGGVTQLFSMYGSQTLESKRSIIGGLFLVRADGELIRIAEAERVAGNVELCKDATDRLRLLGTPKAREYLLKVSEKR
jgi:HEAT repeats